MLTRNREKNRSPHHPQNLAIKRVIALEGDLVTSRSPYPVPTQDVQLGHVWVEGEHPELMRFSYDSNYYGSVRLPYFLLFFLL